MRRFVLLLVLSACWRNHAPAEEPPSFVARVNARMELRRSVEALDKRLYFVVERIAVLRSERERLAVAGDLRVLDQWIDRLARAPELTAEIASELGKTRTRLERAREDLAHATTAEERAARNALDADRDAVIPDPVRTDMLPQDVRRTIILRRRELPPDELP